MKGREEDFKRMMSLIEDRLNRASEEDKEGRLKDVTMEELVFATSQVILEEYLIEKMGGEGKIVYIVKDEQPSASKLTQADSFPEIGPKKPTFH